MPDNSPHVRYDVFLSSTWNDFKDIRPVITEALQRAGYVPRGMEQFPAMTDEVFEYIKKVIDECSYYVVVSGTRYGSVSPLHGSSYTQLEFEYAKAAGLPLLCFVLEEEELRKAVDKVPRSLNQFRKALMAGRNVYLFKSKADLAHNIVAALTDRFASPPKTFWISSNDIDLQNLTRMKSEGLRSLDAASNNADQSASLRDSISVFAMLNDGYGWVRKYEGVLQARFAEANKTTTIVLLQPESPVIASIALRSNKSLDEQVR